MQTPTQLRDTARPAIVIVGNPGTRKTTLALQFPKPYVFDCDNNLASPAAFLKKEDFFFNSGTTGEDGTEIPPAKRFAHFNKCMNEAAASEDVDTLVVDSLTSFIDILMFEVLRQAGKKYDAQMTLPDWGKFGALLKHVIVTLRSSGKTIVFTAHNNMVQDEVSKQWFHMLNVPGAAKTTLTGLFTDCWECTTDTKGAGVNKKTEYIVRTQPLSNQDMRGVKSSCQLPVTFPHSFEPIKKALGL